MEGKIPEVRSSKGSPSAHNNYAVFVVGVAHFHGAVSPRLLPIKQPEGGSLKIPSNYAVVFGGDGTGRWQSGSKFGPLCPSPTAHPDRSNIQLGTILHCLVLGGRPVHDHQQHSHVTKDQEALNKKECPSLCQSDSQIQCHQGQTISISVLLSHPILSRFKTSRRRSP